MVTNTIRDNIPSSDPDIEGRRDLFEDIFARLEIVGELLPSVHLCFVMPIPICLRCEQKLSSTRLGLLNS